MEYDTEIIIPSTFGQIIPLSLVTPTLTTNATYQFEVNNTKKEFIRSIKLNELVLDIVSPQGETFSFINKLDVYISSPNYSEKKVAFKYNVPSTVGGQIICDLSDIDLQEFIKDETFSLRIAVDTDETIPQDITVNIHMKFFVDARLKKS